MELREISHTKARSRGVHESIQKGLSTQKAHTRALRGPHVPKARLRRFDFVVVATTAALLLFLSLIVVVVVVAHGDLGFIFCDWMFDCSRWW